MERRKSIVALLICILIFAAACLFATVFSTDATESWAHAQSGQVVLSEILPSNKTYPAPNGEYLDFVEVRNLSGNPVDISGYMIADDLNSIGYTFPDGTILPGYGYQICWCLKDSESSQYANFGISREGGETIYLYNGSNVIVDQKTMPMMEANTSVIREDESTWTVSRFATPGYANTQEGYDAWLKKMGGDKVQIVISEIMTDNTCITTSEQAIPCDYVELLNAGKKTVELEGSYLSNDPLQPLKWQIPSLTLKSGERVVIYCVGNDNQDGNAPFGLSKSGCTVVLSGALGNILSQVECPAIESDHAWSLKEDGTYQMTDYATPGYENSEAGYQLWLRDVGAKELNVVISEIMTSNRSTVLSRNGMLCDWVELYNPGDAPVTLDGCYLSDDSAERGKWRIPSLTLQPKERVVIRCAGTDAVEGEANFKLSKSGSIVLLSGPQGNIISRVECPRIEDDRSWALQNDGSYLESRMPSPGYENSEVGYLQFRAAQIPAGPLMISEVMSSNDQHLIQSDGNYYDWVELINISDRTVNLADFCLSNDADQLGLMKLPEKKLDPGQRIVIICSANDRLAGKYIQAPFVLSSEECWVYVSEASGKLCDSLHVVDVPYQASIGRDAKSYGIWYYEKPTPGNPNGAGVALISAEPVILQKDGVYADVKKLNVEIQGQGVLHYTLDGSIPTEEDPVYKNGLTLKETTVLRVVSFEENKLPSQPVTACYILNEGHTLPVLSLSVDPEKMFGGTGIYTGNTFDAELPCNLMLFDGQEVFSIDCGIELAGNPQNNPEKKSFQVNFRGRYGADVLGYPVFGQDGAQVFDSLVLSAGSDDGQTMLRDELFSELCLELSDRVSTRRSKFCVLYINGTYWGIYSLKEDMGLMHYAQNAGVSLASVVEIQESLRMSGELKDLADYCERQDLSIQEHYEYVASQVDLDSVVDWLIMQGYSCNSGIEDDQRYYRSDENGGLWQMSFYDLDNAFYEQIGFGEVLDKSGTWNYQKIAVALMQNVEFRSRFLQRLGTALNEVLNSDRVAGFIDGYEARLITEMEREKDRWNGDVEVWAADVDKLRRFVVRFDHEDMLIQSLRQTIGLTEDEEQLYFGG